MNTEEAYKALLEGKKIRKTTWKKDSYIYIAEDGFIYNDNNLKSSFYIDNIYEVWQIYKESILDSEDKKYLSSVIAPFKDRVEYIRRIQCGAYSYIRIYVDSLVDDTLEVIEFPFFKTNSSYRLMKENEKYTLEELDL